jgi:hypothetical protein
MPKKSKTTTEKPESKETLIPYGILYEVPEVAFSEYVNQSKLNKLGEKLGKEITLVSLGFAFPETRENVMLVGNPKIEKEKKTVMIMIASDKSIGEKFHAALKAMNEKVSQTD